MIRAASLLFCIFIQLPVFALGAELASIPFERNESSYDESGPLFQKQSPTETGVDFVNPIDTDHPDDRLYYSAMACGTVAAGDLDGDGQVDLFFANGPIANRLFRQSAAFQFLDVSGESGVSDADSWSTGAAFADVDGDGDLDIYVCCYDSPNRLFINESTPGKLRFSERAAEFGLDVKDAGLMPTFADIDNDGDLDVFVAVNAYYRKGGRPEGGIPVRNNAGKLTVVAPWDRFYGVSGIVPESGEPKYEEIGRPNYLFRNDGGTGFTDISLEAGILRKQSHTNSAAWIDFDDDGDLDLHVGNDFADRDEFYRNDGAGKFTEVAANIFQHTTWFSMGSAAADFNNDGMTDLIVADMLPTSHFREKVTMGEMGASFEGMFAEGLPIQKMANAFFVNTGTGLFFEMAQQSGLARSDWTWTVKSGDFDGDGHTDLFLPTGHTRDFNNSDLSYVTPAMRVGKNYWDFYEDIPELREPNVAFRNLGELKFEPVNAEWGFEGETMSYGTALADLDRDGDLDLVIHQLNDPPAIYRNTAAERGGDFLQIRLKNEQGKFQQNAAKVTLKFKDGSEAVRHLTPQNGYLESDEPILHFGLGQKTPTEIVVNWSTGLSRYEVEEVNRRYEISPSLDSSILEKSETAPPLFRESGSLLSLNFRETPFDDFAKQPLLPHQHSQLGPGHAWGDADGDGRLDLVLSGSAKKRTKLLLNRGNDENGNPIFSMWDSLAFDRDAPREDMGVLFFEADGDGDADLLVVSGSVESTKLADRLYLNDGVGNFSSAPNGTIPDSQNSGSVAAAADFDRDGDLDLFIGGRVVPGKYPEAATSSILVNDGNLKFRDATKQVAPSLEKTGLVTSGIWTDVDSDGWLDLLVTHEWGPIKFFRNKNGILNDQTEAAGLNAHTGWWNSIAAGDFDRDGDIDYVAGNFGRNTKYHPTTDKPEVLFYGDFDGTGLSHLIEAKLEKTGAILPRRGFSCSREAMPGLHGKMKTFSAFASSTLEEIYDPSLLAKAQRFEACTFDSVLLTNDGTGKFDITPLPELAQIAPTFGIAVADFDLDGWPDLVLAQNFYTPQKETGPMNGSLSLLLHGNPNATDTADQFLPTWPRESGILVPGDAKSAGTGDINGDFRPDILIGVNNGPPRLFLNQSAEDGISIRLIGNSGNPKAIGSQVVVKFDTEKAQVREIHAGGGYLSQNSPDLIFHKSDETGEVEISWPSGKTSSHKLKSGTSKFEFTEPE